MSKEGDIFGMKILFELYPTARLIMLIIFVFVVTVTLAVGLVLLSGV